MFNKAMKKYPDCQEFRDGLVDKVNWKDYKSYVAYKIENEH